jgi:uncharacterized phage protein gp47/JayE
VANASISFVAPTAAEIRDNYLRAIKAGLIARGVATPNVGPGSDDYITAQATGNEVEVVSYNTVLAADQLMPDTAIGDNLARIMAIYGLSLKGAGVSLGYIVFSTSATTGVSTDAQLQDPLGNLIKVTTGGTYANGDLIPVESIAVGSATNLAGGTFLKWVSPPAYANPTSPLSADGMSGGVDQEKDDDGRARLLSILRNFPGSGNASQVAAFAEQANPSVEIAFVYDGANGPGTSHVAVAGYASASTSRRRAVTASVLADASSAVQNQLPAYVESVITTTADVEANASFVLTMPAATTASPPGDGSGFVDANPFPSITGATNKRARVIASDITPTSTKFSVESMAAPSSGQSVCWVDRDTFSLHTAKILTLDATYAAPAGSTPGRYGITIDTPFVSTVGSIPADGDYIFPLATNTQTYLDIVLVTFGELGPYEKQLSAALPKALRQPRYYVSNTYSLGDRFLRDLENAGQEVLTAAWGWQNGGTTAPSLPANITDAPNIFVPARLGWYAP